MYDLLEQLGREDVDVIDQELGFELCRLEGVETIVLGSFVKAENIFATDVKVLNVQNKQLLKSATSKGEGVGSILQNQIDDLSKEIALTAGIPEQKIEGTQLKISNVTTASMEAYNFFLRGRDDFEKMYYDDARQFLEKAVQLDSTFAIAYLYLAWSHDYLFNDKQRDEYLKKAMFFADNTNIKEKLFIEAAYARTIEKNPEKRYRILKQIAEKFPNEKRILNELAWLLKVKKLNEEALELYQKVLKLDPDYGPTYNELAYLYGDLGNFEKAEEYLQKYATVSPGDANPFDSIAELYLRMGQTEKAIEKYLEALEVKPDFMSEFRISYIYALKEDFVEALKWSEKIIENAPSVGRRASGFWWKAFNYHWQGKYIKALNALDEAIAVSKPVNYGWGIGVSEWLKAWIYFEQENLELSRLAYQKYFDYLKNSSPAYISNYKADFYFYLGLSYLKKAQVDSAQAMLSEIELLLPQITPGSMDRIKFRQNLLKADILLARGLLDEAIAVYTRESVSEKPFRFNWNFMAYNSPFIQDGLAQIYLQKGDLEQAITVYEKLTKLESDTKSWRIIHPKYHYRLAKLYEENGKINQAQKEYEKFLDIWKNADEDLPELIDAKNRLQNLTNPS
jgi:tetratricopeptide (TPR) repeat protein